MPSIALVGRPRRLGADRCRLCRHLRQLPQRVAHRLHVGVELGDVVDDRSLEQLQVARIVVEDREILLLRHELVGCGRRTHRAGWTGVVAVDVALADIEDRADAAEGADLAGEQVDDAQPRRRGLIGPSDDDAVDRDPRPDICDEKRKEFPAALTAGERAGRLGALKEVAGVHLGCLGFREEGIRRVDESEKPPEKMEGEHKKRRRKDQLEIPDVLGAKKRNSVDADSVAVSSAVGTRPMARAKGPKRQPRKQPGDQVVSHGDSPAVVRAPLPAGAFR